MKSHWLITIILVVVVGAAGFFGGMQYQKSQRSGYGQYGLGGGAGFGRRFGIGAGGANASAVRGQITSVSNGSITVQMRDGSSKIIDISSSTNINKPVTGTTSDLKSGEQVMIFGTTNSDGSVTAQMVQLSRLTKISLTSYELLT